MELASDPGRCWHRAHSNRVGRQFLSVRTVLRRKQNIDSDGGVSWLRSSVLGSGAHIKAGWKIGQSDLRRRPRCWRIRHVLGVLLFFLHYDRKSAAIDSELSFSGRYGAAWVGHCQRIFCPPDRDRRRRRVRFSRALDERLSHCAQPLSCAGRVLRLRAVAFVTSNRDAKARQSRAAVVSPSFSRRHIVARAAADFQISDRFVPDLAALAASLPFLLLVMATLRLPLANPSPIFGLALLLVALLLGLTKIFSLDLLAGVALGSTILLEHAWHFAHFKKEDASIPILWYLGFTAVFTVFPFIFHRQFARKSTVWVSAALAAPLHFFLVYNVVRTTHPSSGMLGLVPAAFAIPSLLGLAALLRLTPKDSPARNAQVALFGGAALFFITLIFPIQFDRQWITLGWAVEGAALCWLFHRVPHPGLRIAGIALLLTSFARLVCNPAVLAYHPRAATPIFNWYLYTYGIVAICLFVAARLLAPPRNLVLNKNAPPLLNSLGTILAFVLLNVQIADYFTKPGAYELTFHFSGNFARDMSYSIAWALFALLLLIVGIRKRNKAARYASLGLLGFVLLKLFFHDLSQLQQLYRIAALIIVAIIAILASFLYQRFLGQTEKSGTQ